MNTDQHQNDPRFVQYYSEESLSEKAQNRAVGIMLAIIRMRSMHGLPDSGLEVADIGCNAGTQSFCWAEQGHDVQGVDISENLVNLARERNRERGLSVTFQVASAESLPWDDASFDVCLLPELLEHVESWQEVLEEAVRILRPGGTLYLSTTNVLCPVQQEFSLPMYSWYPAPLKRKCEKLSVSSHPEWVNFASYPAVHWFNPYRLSAYLTSKGFRTLDRFDIIDTSGRSRLSQMLIRIVRSFRPVRFLGHMATPSTVLIAHRNRYS